MTDSRLERFRGVGVALVTPMRKDGSVDLDAFARHADAMVKGGVDYLVPCGTTGESATLTSEEQARVIGATVEVASGRVPVVAGAGANATHEAVERSVAARKAGADGILSVAPYYNKPPQQGLYRHFEAVAEAAEIPVILYNVPGRTSSNILPETVLRLAELPNVVGIKEASGSLAQVSDILARRPEGFVVLSGDDEITLALLGLGADGLISVIANEAPLEITELVHAGLEGEMERARAMHFRLLELMRSNFLETNPIPVKTAVELLGGPEAHFRLPLVPMSEEGRARLERSLASAGLQGAPAGVA